MSISGGCDLRSLPQFGNLDEMSGIIEVQELSDHRGWNVQANSSVIRMSQNEYSFSIAITQSGINILQKMQLPMYRFDSCTPNLSFSVAVAKERSLRLHVNDYSSSVNSSPADSTLKS